MKHSIKTFCACMAGIYLFGNNARAIGFYPNYAGKSFRISMQVHQNCKKNLISEVSTPKMQMQVFSKKRSWCAEPVSSVKKTTLFRILRSKDANEIFYDMNLDNNGQLNIHNPIEVYWIKFSKGANKEPLNNIQKKYAYGLKFISIKAHEAIFKFVSYDKKIFVLRKTVDGSYKVFVSSLGKLVELNKIFIQVDGGSFWFPKVTRVELHGKDVMTGKQTLETINP